MDETTELRFRILGPLEARHNGTTVRLSGERQRALLAMLVVRANQVVRTDELVDELFATAASDAAVNAVQQAVSRLRRLLGHGGDDGHILTQPGGYMLRADPRHLDARIFEQLVDEGRNLLRAGDASRAAASLQNALVLWRGRPLADVPPLRTLESEIRRLEELWLVATSERIDAELELQLHARLIPEIEALCASHPLNERVHEQLALALYRAGRQSDALAICRRMSARLRDELGLDPRPAMQDLERQILRHDPALEGRAAPVAVTRRALVCPFKGLAAYESSDAEFFCGREQLIADLMARLAESSFVGLLGPSGVGKSSLLRAGILPALAAGALPGSASWRQFVMRPGKHPVTELRRCLAGDTPDRLVTALGGGERIVLAIDQLEELFAACDDEHERQVFVEHLESAARDPERRVLLVLALRADYYGRLAAYEWLAAMLSSNHVLVGPMRRHELVRAIQVPAVRAGLEVEPALVERLVDDLAGEPGALPLLSTMLLELWRLRDGPVLRAQTYDLRGGVRGAVARLAEEAYARLDGEDQRVARRLLLRLASGDGALTRRRVPLRELNAINRAPRVLGILADARLITTGEGEVELSHEALLREWPRYGGWLEEDRVGRSLEAHLVAAAREWQAHGRDPAELYRGARLATAVDWAATHSEDIGRLEHAFLDASRQEAERASRRLKASLLGLGTLLVISIVAGAIAVARSHHATTEARRATAQQLGAAAVIEPRIDLAMLLARGAMALYDSAATESTLLATLLRSPAAISSIELPLGVRPLSLALSPDGRQLLVAANDAHVYVYDPAARRPARGPVPGAFTEPGPVYSPDGGLVVVGDRTSPALDVLTAPRLARLVALRLDPRWQSVQTIDDFDGSLAIAPDRRVVYYAYTVLSPSGPAASYLDRWALPAGRLLSSTRVSAGVVAAIRLIDHGERLVVVGSAGASVLDTHTLTRLKTVAFRLPNRLGTRAAISPDGATATVINLNGVVQFVALATGKLIDAPAGHTAAVQNVAYSPDGRYAVTTGDDGRVIVWNPLTGQPVDQLLGHAGRVTGITFDQRTPTLYTCSLDGTVIAWDLGTSRRFGRSFAFGPAMPPEASAADPLLPPLAMAPDGSRFAVRTDTSRVGIYSVANLKPEVSFAVPRAHVVTALAWSPTSPLLAVGGEGGTVSLWRVNAGVEPLLAPQSLGAQSVALGAVGSIAFSRDGRWLAAADSLSDRGGSAAGRLTVWALAHGGASTATQLRAPATAVAFSPTSRLLAVGLADGGVLITDVHTGETREVLHAFEGANGGTTSLAFSPSGTLAVGDYAGILQTWNPLTGAAASRPVLAASAPVASVTYDRSGKWLATTGGPGGGLKLWAASTLQQVGATLDPEAATWGNAAFTPDGRTLLSVNANGTGSTWSVDPHAWAAHACLVAGRSLTQEEWSRFVTGYSYSRVCP